MSQYLSTDEIRRRWIQFFKSKEHLHLPSDSLVPANDKSVLFSGAGMNQFKDHFAGLARLDHHRQRAVTVQKCVRAGDIDNVGRTPSHHTFFEMLGNFSFGDYFKDEAVQWAVEFLLDPQIGLGFARERLSVTVYSGDVRLGIPKDEEAIAAWKRHAPWLKDDRAPGGWRIYEYGEHDNFWPADAPSLGPNGPCGPCSEIYYDVHPAWEREPSAVPAPVPVASDERRYCEIWNLVFTQYDRRDVGKLAPLPNKNIDTGAGLERMARTVQGKMSNFETDLLYPIVQAVASVAGKSYGQDPESDRRMRRITDHVRLSVFAIGDGVNPENEGRNYVVRRLMRRAMLDGLELGIQGAFLAQIARSCIRQMQVGYPELLERQESILRIIEREEAAFTRTLSQGRQHFEEIAGKAVANGLRSIPGNEAFRLWDTFGFPFELTVESAHALSLQVDEAGFRREMDEAVRRSQAGSNISKEIFKSGPLAELCRLFAGQPTVFEGYDGLRVAGARVLALVGPEGISDYAERGTVTVLLDRTPFYAESGGQVGDRGMLRVKGVAHQVQDTQKHEGLVLHTVHLNGPLRKGEGVSAEVSEEHRLPTIRHHSSTHLLHYALRKVLGTHVEQRGSLVSPERLRFDFTHFEALSQAQIAQVESLVNERVLENLEVRSEVRPLEEARAEGAMALFGEKYGSQVRMVRMGPSLELCGGTHCRWTGQIGYFRIVGEGAIAAGVRRIEALAGAAAVADARRVDEVLGVVAATLKSPREELAGRLAALQEERANLLRQLEGLKRKAASSAAGEMVSQARPVAGTRILAVALEGADAKALRDTLDAVRKSLPEGAVVLGGSQEGRVALLVSLSPELIKRGGHAGNLLKEIAPLVGGKGGGKPDLAQGGGKDVERLPEAFAAAEKTLAAMLG